VAAGYEEGAVSQERVAAAEDVVPRLAEDRHALVGGIPGPRIVAGSPRRSRRPAKLSPSRWAACGCGRGSRAAAARRATTAR
jgi:hypothetical protein